MQFKKFRVSLSWILVILASTGLALLATSQANAQTPKYKEGDRVEVDTLEALSRGLGIGLRRSQQSCLYGSGRSASRETPRDCPHTDPALCRWMVAPAGRRRAKN